MFLRFRLARYMKAEVYANTAVVPFARNAQRIATVHQFCWRDRVKKDSPTAGYSVQKLLGFNRINLGGIVDVVIFNFPF